jgi:hypothetical protein
LINKYLCVLCGLSGEIVLNLRSSALWGRCGPVSFFTGLSLRLLSVVHYFPKNLCVLRGEIVLNLRSSAVRSFSSWCFLSGINDPGYNSHPCYMATLSGEVV